MKLYGLGSVITLTIVGIIFFTVSAGCGGSGGECVGTVQYQGKTFEGKDKTADQAKHNACNNYCSEADPEYDAVYRMWLDSPKGKAAGSPSKKEAVFKDKDKRLLDYITITCANRCVAEMNPEAKCK